MRNEFDDEKLLIYLNLKCDNQIDCKQCKNFKLIEKSDNELNIQKRSEIAVLGNI